MVPGNIIGISGSQCSGIVRAIIPLVHGSPQCRVQQVGIAHAANPAMLGNLPAMNGKRIACVEPMGLNSNGRRQLRPLLRQHAQYVAVLTHDRFGQRHLCLKAGVAWGQVKAVGSFR